jgi:hypothetical protein
MGRCNRRRDGRKKIRSVLAGLNIAKKRE